MKPHYIIPDSGMYKVINQLKNYNRGSILTADDFKDINGLTYTNIRTLFVNLCTKNVLIRVSRGVYCYPKIKDGKPIFPQIITVLTRLAEKGNYEICPAGEYAEFLMGIKETMPNIIICHTTGKIKTINIENGINVKVVPSKRYFYPFIRNIRVRILVNYIKNVGIENINNRDKEKLIDYYNNIGSLDKTEKGNIPAKIISFLEKCDIVKK